MNARAQVVIYGFNGFTGKPLPITVQVKNKTFTSAVDNPGIVKLNYSGYEEVLIKSAEYEEYRKRINGSVQGKHNIALIPLENALDPVVITDVFKNRNSNNTVLNVTTIEAQEIEQLGAFDLKDALSFQSGLRISRDNALGSSGISINGIGGDNVKFLIDGVPVIGRFFNQLDLEQFNLDNIQQIEVVEGPMSVIYGSNALAGSINLVTRTPDKASKFSLNSNYESDGQYNVSLTGSKNINNHSITITGGRMLFDGWKANPETRDFTWIPKEQYTLRGQYQYKKDDVSVVLRSEGLRAFLLDRGMPIVPYEETAIDQRFYNNRLDNSLTYTNKIGGNTLDMMLSNNTFHRVKNKYFKDLVTLGERLVPQASEQDTQTFNASVLRTILALDNEKTRGFETLFGIDANYEFGKGQRIKEDLQRLMDIALFLSTEKQVTSSILLRGGLRYAYNSNFKSTLLYSLQSRINLRNSQVLKVAYGKGFRAPSLKELYLDFLDSNHEVFGNVDLLPETSHSITASYSKYFLFGDVELNSTVEGFYNHITNKIELISSSPTAAQYGNIGLFESVGGEFHQNIGFKQFKLQSTFNYTGVYNSLISGEDAFFWSPQLTIQPNYTVPNWKTNISVFFNYFGAVNRVFTDSESAETSIQKQDPYTMMDVTMNQPFFERRLRVTLGARNLFNVVNVNSQLQQTGAHTAASNAISISPGRTIFMSLKYEISK